MALDGSVALPAGAAAALREALPGAPGRSAHRGAERSPPALGLPHPLLLAGHGYLLRQPLPRPFSVRRAAVRL